MLVGSRSPEFSMGWLYYEIVFNIYLWAVECNLTTNIMNVYEHFIKN
jgi:hypothetical protein